MLVLDQTLKMHKSQPGILRQQLEGVGQDHDSRCCPYLMAGSETKNRALAYCFVIFTKDYIQGNLLWGLWTFLCRPVCVKFPLSVHLTKVWRSPFHAGHVKLLRQILHLLALRLFGLLHNSVTHETDNIILNYVLHAAILSLHIAQGVVKAEAPQYRLGQQTPPWSDWSNPFKSIWSRLAPFTHAYRPAMARAQAQGKVSITKSSQRCLLSVTSEQCCLKQLWGHMEVSSAAYIG